MSKRRRHQQDDEQQIDYRAPEMAFPAKPGPLEAKTQAQRRYLRAIASRDITFGVGEAGTGKTFLAVAAACDALREHRTERIIITRPAVEAAGESLGFLPGELDQKFAPYLRPVLDILRQRLGKGPADYALKAGQIEAIPLAYMRGMTLDRAWIILDEAQNTTPEQMRMFLTRVGEGSKVIVNGDLAQSDISGVSGLRDALDVVGHLPRVEAVEFGPADVVRSGLCGDIVRAYSERASGSGR